LKTTLSIAFSLNAIIPFAFISSPSLANTNEITLCQQHEEIYFSCKIANDIASICASGNISPNNGYVQYRFGRENKIDLEFPSKPYPPRNRFSISDISVGSVNSTHLKFKSGGYDYVLYDSSMSGIYVKKNGKIISNLICEPGIYNKISPRAFRGIKTTPPVNGIDD